MKHQRAKEQIQPYLLFKIKQNQSTVNMFTKTMVMGVNDKNTYLLFII